MDIMNAVTELGKDAVLRYRTISQRPDNELPEVFLGGYVAPRLYDQFHCPVHVEYNYLLLASSRKVQITQNVVNQIGNFRADIAIYPAGEMPLIIEFKVFDERRQPSSIVKDLDKMKTLSRLTPVRGYAGVLICETRTASLDLRIRNLEEGLGQKVHTGSRQKSVDGSWEWCFGYTSVPEIH